jgi:signal peptidase I
MVCATTSCVAHTRSACEDNMTGLKLNSISGAGRILTDSVAALALFGVAFLFVAPVVLHSTPEIVVSGSMEPAIPVGSVVFVSAVPADLIGIGDIVAFHPQDQPVLITHRVVGVSRDGPVLGFRTQGDANNTPDDGLVAPSAVAGRVWLVIPFLGYLADFVHRPEGLILLLALPAGLLIVSEVHNIARQVRAGRTKKASPPEVSALL